MKKITVTITYALELDDHAGIIKGVDGNLISIGNYTVSPSIEYLQVVDHTSNKVICKEPCEECMDKIQAAIAFEKIKVKII